MGLKRIKDPESELSLFELELVQHIDYENIGRKLIIALDFDRRMPNCMGCKPIAWIIQKKIVDELKSEFLGFDEVQDIDFKFL